MRAWDGQTPLVAIAGVLALTIAALSTPASAANSVTECDAALSKDIYSEAVNDKVDWRLSTLVTEKDWKEAHDKFGLNVVVYGVPIGASYEDYQKNVRDFYSLHNESYSRDFSRTLAIQQFSGNNLAGYQACLQALRTRSPGLFLSIDHVTTTTAVLHVFYDAGGNDPNSIPLSWLDNNHVFAATPPNRIKRNTDVTLQVLRPKAGDATVNVNGKDMAGVNGDAIVIPPYVRKPLPVWTLIVYPADDHMDCSVNGTPVASVNFGEPASTTTLKNVHPGKNTLVCHARDDHPDSNFNPCWSWGYALLADGYQFIQDSDRRCGPGSPAQPTVKPVTFDDVSDDGTPTPLKAILPIGGDLMAALRKAQH